VSDGCANQAESAAYQRVEKLFGAATVDEAYDAALEAVAASLGCARASIQIFDETGAVQLAAMRGLSPAFCDAASSYSPWQPFDRDVAPICVPDVSETAGPLGLKSAAEGEGVRALILAPVVSGDRVLGTLIAYDSVPRAYSQTESALAAMIARQLGACIARAPAGVRTRAQQSERINSEQFRLLVEGVTDYAIYMLDPDGRVSTWNAGAHRAKGYTEDEILDQHFSIFYTPEARAAGEPERALRAARETGRIEMQGWRVRKDGTQFWAHVVIDSIRDENLRLIGYAKITRDTTEQRHAAERLQEAREALFQSQKMEAVGQLTGGIAHDFNNMLAGIMGSLQLLQRRLKAERYDETDKYMAAALDSANRAAGLTSRLLAFGRRQTLDLKPIDVNETVGSMEVLLARTVSENVSIDLQVGAEPLWASTDAHQLESAILNLALNARDAMASGGRLTIVTGRERIVDGAGDAREAVAIDVIDTGSGMAPAIVARAFEPFFTTKPIGAGTGLGLSMVYGFVNQSGGRIDLSSTEGAGTRVRLLLPAATELAEEDVAEAVAAASGRGEVVLVVEDEAQLRMLIVDVLRDLGYAAREAGNADEALPVLESGARIDLLVTDVGLPGLNGRQLSEIARRMRPELKVLFLTGYAEHAAVRSSFVQSGMDLMQKPFRVEDLAQRIQTMVTGAAV